MKIWQGLTSTTGYVYQGHTSILIANVHSFYRRPHYTSSSFLFCPFFCIVQTLIFAFFAGTRIVWPADPLTARICDELDCLRSDILPCELPQEVFTVSCEIWPKTAAAATIYKSCCGQVFLFLSFNRRPIVYINQKLEKRYKVDDSLCTFTIKIWENLPKFCDSSSARWCPWY